MSENDSEGTESGAGEEAEKAKKPESANMAKAAEERIFREAVEAKLETREERTAWLERACGGDRKLRARVEQLLDASGDPAHVLHTIAARLRLNKDGATGSDAEAGRGAGSSWQERTSTGEDDASTGDSDPPLGERSGDSLGHYVLLEEIGRGGMGTVWLAEQCEPVSRKVALKIVKLGMDTREVVARFEAERQALAMMDHSGIARVFDAGATRSGRPYFVMELVEGLPLTRFCDERRLGIRDRLALFIEVCRAVQHAHQKGVIHRDLKPSNILVAEQDGRPAAKVIDFGVAKAISERLTDETLRTGAGGVVGTLAYMSPEQAAGETDVDTRSDIYSLGVVLFELLGGTIPFGAGRFHELSLDQAVKVILEEEAPRLSTRLRRTGESGAEVARKRSTDVHKLARVLRGDLDWIVTRALEKDRERRYETANALALDVEHFLRNEPVDAGPPSATYRMGKFVRRNRAGVAFAATVAFLLVAGIIVSSWLAFRASVAESEAKREAVTSQQVAKFLQEMLEGVGPSVARGRDTTVLREILDRTSARVDKDLKDQPEVAAEIKSTLGRVYNEIGEHEKSETMFRQALTAFRKFCEEPHAEIATTLNFLGVQLANQARFEESETVLRESLAMSRRLTKAGSIDGQMAAALHTLGMVLRARDKLIEAEKVLRESLAIRRNQAKGGESEEVANAMRDLAVTLGSRGREEESLTLLRETLEMYKRLHGENHPAVAGTLAYLGDALGESDPAEAELMLRKALEMARTLYGERQHRDVGVALGRLANFLRGQKRMEEAESLLRDAQQVIRDALGENHPDYGVVLMDLGTTINRQGRHGEGEQFLRKSVEILRDTLGEKHSYLADALENLVGCLRDQKKQPEAEETLRELLVVQESLLGKKNLQVADTLDDLAYVMGEQGKLADAEEITQRSLAIYRELLPAEDRRVADALSNLAASFAAQRRYGEAEPLLRESLELQLDKRPGESGLDAALNNLLVVLRRQGKDAEADALMRASLDRYRASLATLKDEAWQDAFNDTVELVQALLGQGDHPEIARFLEEIWSWRRDEFGEEAAATREAADLLFEYYRAVGRVRGKAGFQDPSVASVLVPPDSEWKWLHPTDGRDPGEEDSGFHPRFSAPDFDDSGWKSGRDQPGSRGGFAYGEAPFAGVDIGQPEDLEHRHSAYLRHRFRTEETHSRLELRCQYDDGIVVYLDGVEVARGNMPEGPDAYHLPAASPVSGRSELAVRRLTIDRELEPGDHVLSISVHNVAGGSSDLRVAGITLVELAEKN